MPVWLAIGGVVVGAIIKDNYNDYSNYGDYSNYSDHSDYNDYAERQRIRKEAAQNEYDSARESLNPEELREFINGTNYEYYDDYDVDDWEDVDEDDLNDEVLEEIDFSENSEINEQTSDINEEISEINNTISLLQERKKYLTEQLNK